MKTILHAFRGRRGKPLPRYRNNAGSPRKWTFAQAKRIVKDNGGVLTVRDGEYRVNRRGGLESTAYYTNDLGDAIDTAIVESGSWKKFLPRTERQKKSSAHFQKWFYGDNPRKNLERVYAAWQRGVKLDHGQGKSVSTNGETIWSYETWIVYRDYRGEVMFNTTKYSHTTTVQQSSLRQLLDEDGVVYKKAKNVKRGSHSPVLSFGATLENPSMITFGNPPKGILSRNVTEIKYQHVVDGKFYRHKFARNQVEIRADENGTSALLRRVDGKPLTKDY